ncbi:MAG: hypothetical protein J7K94_01045 [Dehalococcoidia bacterium]|nr:hypothetical protein [Dehalococcoidia bacterium]
MEIFLSSPAPRSAVTLVILPETGARGLHVGQAFLLQGAAMAPPNECLVVASAPSIEVRLYGRDAVVYGVQADALIDDGDGAVGRLPGATYASLKRYTSK